MGFEFIHERLFSLIASDVDINGGDMVGCACSQGCGNDCPCNRKFFECHSHCFCTETCSLRETQNKSASDGLVVTSTAGKGQGIISTDKIAKDTFVIEYTGEVVMASEVDSTRETNYVLYISERMEDNSTNHSFYIDATEVGNIARYINHSCSPNLRLQLIRREGITFPHPCFFTTKEVLPGEELSFDYAGQQTELTKNAPLGNVPCHCGSKNCRNFLPYDTSSK